MKKMMTRAKKKAFTLLELMICFFLIGGISSALFIKGHALVAHHRFKCVSQSFLHELKRWKLFCMTTGSDVSCKIVTTDEGYRVFWNADFPIKEEESSLLLTETRELQLKGKKIKELSFTIDSRGALSISEFLSLVPKNPENTLLVDLSYPMLFIQGPFDSSMKTSLEKSGEPFYPKRKKDM